MLNAHITIGPINTHTAAFNEALEAFQELERLRSEAAFLCDVLGANGLVVFAKNLTSVEYTIVERGLLIERIQKRTINSIDRILLDIWRIRTF